MSSYEEFNSICTVAEQNLLKMPEKDNVLLCSQLKLFDRVKRVEARMNIVWVPYIISETVMAETQKFTSRGKTFTIASINDMKVSVEEAVQTFESL